MGDLLGRVALIRRIHHVDPDRERDLASERAAINFLRLVESRPDRAGNRVVVTGKKRVGKIVSGSSFSGGGKFVQFEFVPRRASGSALQILNAALEFGRMRRAAER